MDQRDKNRCLLGPCQPVLDFLFKHHKINLLKCCLSRHSFLYKTNLLGSSVMKSDLSQPLFICTLKVDGCIDTLRVINPCLVMNRFALL